METKFNIFMPKYYEYYAYREFEYYYERKRIDWKQAIIDRKATKDIKRFIKNCECDIKELSKSQIENLFVEGFILVRISYTESILTYREHVKRGFNLVFMQSKEYQKLRKQFIEEVVKNG